MKKLFLMLAAAAAVASCSKDYTIVADQGEAIEFGSFVENSTRADAATDPSYTAATLKKFQVWGTVSGGNGLVSIFDGDDVNGIVGSTGEGDNKVPNVWHCDVKQYWIKDAIYNFAALVNATNDLTMVADLPTEVKGFTADGATDLLYADAKNITGKASGNGPVNFNFAHLLSKVKFTVKNNSKAAEEYSFKVNNIVIKGKNQGDVTLASKTWDTTASSEHEYEVAEIVVDKNTDNAGQECATELLLIPGDFAITFNVDIYNGTTKLGSQSYPVEPGTSYEKTLAVGNAYNFVITVAVGEEITFSVTEQPEWGNGNTTDTNEDHVNDSVVLK